MFIILSAVGIGLSLLKAVTEKLPWFLVVALSKSAIRVPSDVAELKEKELSRDPVMSPKLKVVKGFALFSVIPLIPLASCPSPIWMFVGASTATPLVKL